MDTANQDARRTAKRRNLAILLVLGGCAADDEGPWGSYVRVEPDEVRIDFGAVAIGEVAQREFEIITTGRGEVTATAHLVEGDAGLSLDPAIVVLRPNSSTKFRVRFAPSGAPGRLAESMGINVPSAEPAFIPVFVTGQVVAM